MHLLYSVHVGSGMLGCMKDTVKYAPCFQILTDSKKQNGYWKGWLIWEVWCMGEQKGGQDLRELRSPLNAYCQSIPKYSWSAVCSNTARHWGHTTSMARCLPKDGEVELRHRTQKSTKYYLVQYLPRGPRFQRQKHPEKALWRWGLKYSAR